MDDFWKLKYRINCLLEAMLACGRAFPSKVGTEITVEVSVERSECGYVPAVMVDVENLAGAAPDVSVEKSKVASRAVLLALAMENTGTMTLEGAKVRLESIPGTVDASLKVETASKRQSQEIGNILGLWVHSKTFPARY